MGESEEKWCKLILGRRFPLMARRGSQRDALCNTVPLCHCSAILEIIPWMQTVCAVSVSAVRQGCVFFVCLLLIWTEIVHPCVCWKKRSLFFFADKKYSGQFRKYQLNHWWQMDYPGNAFHTFLGLDIEIYLVVNGTVTRLPVFIQNIIKCVPKTNKAFTGLERDGGKW